MKRRHFLTVLTSAFAGLAPLRAGGEPAARRVPIQESPLAGFQYHRGERLWGELRVGDALELVPEPDNPYDAQAVRVDWHGHKLGYIPRVENTAVSQMLRRGERLGGRITCLRDSPAPWERLRLAVDLWIRPL